MANTTRRHSPAGRGPEGGVGPSVDGGSWEQLRLRVSRPGPLPLAPGGATQPRPTTIVSKNLGGILPGAR